MRARELGFMHTCALISPIRLTQSCCRAPSRDESKSIFAMIHCTPASGTRSKQPCYAQCTRHSGRAHRSGSALGSRRAHSPGHVVVGVSHPRAQNRALCSTREKCRAFYAQLGLAGKVATVFWAPPAGLLRKAKATTKSLGRRQVSLLSPKITLIFYIDFVSHY